MVYNIYKKLTKDFKLVGNDTRKLWLMIERVCNHEEFIKRCKAPYFHHGEKTLGEHILSDVILTYKITKKINSKTYKNKINIKTAVYIALFHDLYELPWQNASDNKKFCNAHGFRHPIEAAVNAITWFPEYFRNKEKALVIIDGIIHHMYPFPVRVFDDTDLELNNKTKYDNLDNKYKEMIIASTNIGKFGRYSFRKTFFVEGRIVSCADKKVSLKKDLKDFSSYFALITGRNSKISY